MSMSEDDGFGVCDVGETLAIPVRPDVVYREEEKIMLLLKYVKYFILFRVTINVSLPSK